MSILAYQDDYHVALLNGLPRLLLPMLIRVGLVERAVLDAVVCLVFGLLEEIILEIVVLVELEAHEYAESWHFGISFLIMRIVRAHEDCLIGFVHAWVVRVPPVDLRVLHHQVDEDRH